MRASRLALIVNLALRVAKHSLVTFLFRAKRNPLENLSLKAEIYLNTI